jgi:hypothetical protein
MPRTITVGAAQLRPIAPDENRSDVIKRLPALLARPARPELALTTSFPRWRMEDQAEIDAFFERAMPAPTRRGTIVPRPSTICSAPSTTTS